MSLDDDVFPLPRREVCDRVRERRRGEKTGVGKDNPNKHLVDISPSTPKLITVPLRSWHLSVVTRSVRVQRERTEKARQRRRERVRVSKQEGLCHCLFVCVCVCVCPPGHGVGLGPRTTVVSEQACLCVYVEAGQTRAQGHSDTDRHSLSLTHSDLTGPIQHGLLCWISRGHWLWPGWALFNHLFSLYV